MKNFYKKIELFNFIFTFSWEKIRPYRFCDCCEQITHRSWEDALLWLGSDGVKYVVCENCDTEICKLLDKLRREDALKYLSEDYSVYDEYKIRVGKDN